MHSRTALILCCFSPLLAADPSQRKLAPFGVQSLLETTGGLMLILLLIFGGAWLYKRYGQLPTLGKGLIRVLGGVSVGPRERVVLLKVDNTRLVVGVAPGQVRTLYILDSEDSGASFSSQLAEVKHAEAPGSST